MNIYKSKTYIQQINYIQSKNTDSLMHFANSNFLISGATGLVLSYLIDTLLTFKSYSGKIFALVRNVENAKNRFSAFANDNRLVFIQADFSQSVKINLKDKVDYVISGASLVSPSLYAKYPVDVININLNSTNTLLTIANNKNAKFLLLSSSEVYGLNEKEYLLESDETIYRTYETRSCYNLAKATSENLCFCYSSQFNVTFNIMRLSRIFGPTMKMTDNKAMSQFILKANKGEDIVLKSAGVQLFNYQYVADTVISIFYVLLFGKDNSIYNSTSDELKSLRDIAGYIAKKAKTKLVFQINDEFDGKGYSKVTTSVMSIKKIKSLGFDNIFSIYEGIDNTLTILEESEE